METFGLIVVLGVGIAIGMYISSQIINHIDDRTRHKKFMEDMEKFDNKNK